MLQTVDTKVRHLRRGDVVNGSEVIALGQVTRDRAFAPKYVYFRNVRLRNPNGDERVASWRPDTRMRVARPMREVRA